MSPTTPSDDVRRRLLAGEPLTSLGVASDYGVTRSLLGTVIGSMERSGVTFARERTEGKGTPVSYRVTNGPVLGAGADAEWGKRRGVRKLGHRGSRDSSSTPAAKRTPAVRAAVNGKPLTDHPVPALGETVQVFLLALTDDGRVNVGLRHGERTWLTTVDGFSAK